MILIRQTGQRSQSPVETERIVTQIGERKNKCGGEASWRERTRILWYKLYLTVAMLKQNQQFDIIGETQKTNLAKI